MGGIRLVDIGHKHTRWNLAHVEPCEYVFDGERVLYPTTGNKACWVIVTCAAGHHARIKGKTFEKWVNVRDLARNKPDPNSIQ